MKTIIKNVIFYILATLFAQLSFATSSDNFNNQKYHLKLIRITPTGKDIPIGRQIVFQFNRPVVSIGRMERKDSEIPVSILPKLNCQWRWLNTSSLACQLDEKNSLKKATKYKISMKPGIKAEDGSTLDKEYKHEFITQRPFVTNYYTYKWESPGTPVVQLQYNQPVSGSSVEKHIKFIYKKDDSTVVSVKFKAIVADEKSAKIWGEGFSKIWYLTPVRELPLDTKIDLVVEPGIVSFWGKETGIESKIIANLHTFPEFKFIGVRCKTNYDKVLFIKEEDSVYDIDKCNPLGLISLVFSSPVMSSQLRKNIIVNPDLSGGRKDYNPWENTNEISQLGRYRKEGTTYLTYLPESLKSEKQYTIKTKPVHLSFFQKIKSFFMDIPLSDLRDEFGRVLKKPIDIKFKTDNRPPNYKLNYSFGVLEKDIDSDVPIYVTNIDDLSFEYKSLTPKGSKDNQSLNIDVPKIRNMQFSVPMQIRKILNNKSGVVYGKFYTKPYIRDGYSKFFAITPYQVHVKQGYSNTLVWVTDLATGEPVKNAKVQLYIDSIKNLSASFKALDVGKTNSSGLVLLKGRSEIDPNLKFKFWSVRNDDEQVIIRVDKDDDMALIPLNSNFSVYLKGIYSSQSKKFGHIHTWGTTAQGVYRAGDKIQYKFYVRNQDNDSYIMAPRKKYTLKIIDSNGKTVQETRDITLSEFGSYVGEYLIPKNAAVGWYDFELSSDFTNYKWYPMKVLVSDFTPAPFKVLSGINGDLFHPGELVEVSTIAKLHSGGAYTDAETRVTATLRAGYFSSKHPIASNFTFDSYKDRYSEKIFSKIDNIDDKGELTLSFNLPKEDIVFGYLTVESSVRDERGKYVSSTSRADYLGVDRLVGLKSTEWLYKTGKPAKIKYLVVDEHRTPVASTNVKIKVLRREMKVAKVKGAGNAYLNRYIKEWVPAGYCEGVSKKEPLTCSFTPKKPGIYQVIADIKDTKGNPHSTKIRVWVSGSDYVTWDSPYDNSLTIIPEKTEYKIGDKAKYLIKNPYPGAKALITIERFGVLKSWVETLDSSTPVIEFDIEKDFMPGFYLSVVVFSPRVDAPIPGIGQVDLGKPSSKIGYVNVPVRDPYKKIDISIKTDKEVYKPREKIKVAIHAESKNKDKEEKIEIAVVVLDEAVLDLIKGGEKYFDPYEGFYKSYSWDLINFSLLERLIGKQKTGKKGANPGGDGGSSISLRTLFKYVSYWNPSVKTNKKGNATIEFKAPDNLTGWRILAFAVTPTDKMGLGDKNFKVNRPTEIRPVMPNQVIEGDYFKAGFSVMNRTGKPRDLNVTINAIGNVKKAVSFSKTIHLEPYKRQIVYIPVASKRLSTDIDKLTDAIVFTATAKDSIDGDGIKHSVPIYKRRTLNTVTNYGSIKKDSIIESIIFPKDIYPDSGDLSVVLYPTVIGNVEGSFRYMRDYSYSCWEQKLSKAVMASHYLQLKEYLPDKFKWDESKVLPNEILALAANYQAPSGGMAYFTPLDRYVSPYLSAYTALAFTWLRDAGYKIPEGVESRLYIYLDRLLKNDIVPSYYSTGMSSTVRSLALFALAKYKKINLSDLERYLPHVKAMSLFGKAHYLQAALNVDGADKITEEVANMILAHSNQSSGKFVFSEELDDSYSRILATSNRSNCSILSAFTKYLKDKKGATIVGDVLFKLVRNITRTRGKRNHWRNTQENVFCVNSLIDYSRVYENVKPNMHVSVKVDDKRFGNVKFKDLGDRMVTLTRSITKRDLGVKRKIKISKEGKGRLYYATRMNYATLQDHAVRVNAGIDIRKEYSVQRDNKWVLLDNTSTIKHGDLVRIDIYVSLPTSRNFVVVEDPVPGGLEPVNRDLANTSVVDVDKGSFKASSDSWWFKFNDWITFNSSYWGFYHKEMRLKAVRFYSDYLAAGNYHLSYTAQAIVEGDFAKLPVYAEEMYAPDIFGMGVPGTLKVEKND